MPIRQGLVQQQQTLTDFIISGGSVTFVTLDASTAQRVADLRSRYNIVLADAFQVAAAVGTGCDAFLTNDASLNRVQELPILVVGDLEL